MQIRFLSDGTEYRSFGGGSFSRNNSSSGLFWWTILITLLMGAAIFCWFFCIVVFSHPERPFHYRLLTRLNKLEPIREFSKLSVPQGKFLSAREALAAYFSLTPVHLSVENDILKRSYIRNYKETEREPQYLKGEFSVIGSRPLTDGDVFTSGWVVRARSNDIEDVDIELILPGARPGAARYAAGDKIVLDQKSTFASTVHVQKLAEDRLCITVVPIAYQGFAVPSGPIAMEAPQSLNMDALWPIAADLDAPLESGIGEPRKGATDREPQGQKVAAQTAAP